MAREKNDSSANHGGMRSAKMPAKEFERMEGKLGHTCNEKYATEFGNPKDLDRANEGLASYVKKNKMKY
jgi:hypothetical protein